jgi:hypothetical protein
MSNFSPLQLTRTRNITGLLESNHLSNAFLTEPEKVGAIVAYAFGTTKDNVLSLLTGGIGNTKFINNKEYEWSIMTKSERSIEVASLVSGGSTPGIGGSIFQVAFVEKFFEPNDNLVSDNGTQVRVSGAPVQDGNTWIYNLQLTNLAVSFIDPLQVAAGARFSKDYSTVEEYSSRGGGVNFNTPFTLRNQLTTLRKSYTVTRDAATDYMVLELTAPDGKSKTKLWTKAAEWNAMYEFYKEIDRQLIYSTYNRLPSGETNIKGDNGRPVYHGAGLRQQVSPSNLYEYTQLSYDFLDNVLLDLSYAASKEGGNHKFVALTGKMGMREFDRAISQRAKDLGVVITDSSKFITGSGMNLTLEGAFRTVKFLNGVELTVKEFSPYDDIQRHRELHPVTKKPLESYRFTILNFGTTSNGTSNIVKMAKKDSEMMIWHVAGSVDPMGGIAKSITTSRASGIDGYDVHFAAEVGLMVQDPTSCAEIVMNLG